jgi:DNA gyrase/topoisomerase IV subunit B
MDNVELRELHEIINSEGYPYVIFSTDQDLDGIHIRGLGITFGYTHNREMLLKGQMGMLQTPLIGIKKGNKLVDWVYRIDDLTPEIERKGTAKYYKGLGSWKESDLKEVVEKDGLRKMIDIFEFDEEAELNIKGWFDPENIDFRKTKIQANEFSLIKL